MIINARDVDYMVEFTVTHRIEFRHNGIYSIAEPYLADTIGQLIIPDYVFEPTPRVPRKVKTGYDVSSYLNKVHSVSEYVASNMPLDSPKWYMSDIYILTSNVNRRLLRLFETRKT